MLVQGNAQTPEIKLRPGRRKLASSAVRRSISIGEKTSLPFSFENNHKPGGSFVIVTEKIRTIKVKILPYDITTWVVIPGDSKESVSDLEQKLRSQLNVHTYQEIELFSLHLDSAPISSCDVLNEKYKMAKEFTFQKPVYEVKKHRNSLVSKLTIHDVGFASMLDNVMKQDSLKADLAISNQKLKGMKKKYAKLKDKSPLSMKEVIVSKKIGKGAGGEVFSCCVNGWVCAMKECDASEPGTVAELAALEKIPTHPNLVQYFTHRIVDSRMQLFLRLYSGTLKDIINERVLIQKPFSPLEIVYILSDIACGLKALHKHKIIHRDLKSANVFYSNDLETKSKVYAIGDLDTAKVLTAQAKAKTVIGTPVFMAPEVLTSKNETEYTSKVDIFSLGMIIFEILHLNTPYTEIGKSFEVSRNIVEGILPQMNEFDESYNPIIKLYHQCVSYDPKDRPTTKLLIASLAALLKTYSPRSSSGTK